MQELLAGVEVDVVSEKYEVPKNRVAQWRYRAEKATKEKVTTNRVIVAGVSPFLGHSTPIWENDKTAIKNKEVPVSSSELRPESDKLMDGPMAIKPNEYTFPKEMQNLYNEFSKVWDALRQLVPGSTMEQDVVESYILRMEGFVAGVE